MSTPRVGRAARTQPLPHGWLAVPGPGRVAGLNCQTSDAALGSRRATVVQRRPVHGSAARVSGELSLGLNTLRTGPPTATGAGRRRRVRRVVPPPRAIRLAWGPARTVTNVTHSAPGPAPGRPQPQQRATSASRPRTSAPNAGDASAGGASAGGASAGVIARSGRAPPEQDVLRGAGC